MASEQSTSPVGSVAARELGSQQAAIEVRFIEGPLGVPGLVGLLADEIGAHLTFEGIVRPTEQGRGIAALVYEAYQPMATLLMQGLAARCAQTHGILAVVVEHSVGRVEVGQVSFRLVMQSRHRAALFGAMAEFIDCMKRDVPLWKRVEYVG